MPNSGIYQMRNLNNEHVYIGSSINLSQRQEKHCVDLERDDHFNQHLQRAWNKYGGDRFAFEVLIYCAPTDCVLYEQRFLDSRQPEYNLSPTAGSCLGVKRSKETKRKLAEAARYRVWTEESRRKVGDASRGRKHTEETKRKMLEAYRRRTPDWFLREKRYFYYDEED